MNGPSVTSTMRKSRIGAICNVPSGSPTATGSSSPVRRGEGRDEGSIFSSSPPPDETLIVVGASAGGPAALVEVLAHLPADFPASIVVIQHLDPQFAPLLISWLESRSPLGIRLAEPNDCPERGVALLAGRDAHLVFTSPRCLAYVSDPSDSIYRPSIDQLFQSAERFWLGQIVGVLLTGIGSDGAQGLRQLRIAGHHTIAQDDASSAVYGMPKAAAELAAATDILPLNSIAPRLIELVATTMQLHA